MSDVVVRVDDLGKCYQLARRRQRGQATVGEAIAAGFRGLGRFLARRPREDVVPFWALRDVSFEVKKGEVLGLIGRNGAGKSTLLKLLSRITEPTTGRIGLRGRVASLLEVGTGFHPELTGRENVYLNGAILGMRRSEINRKFAEIVAFAEIEQFLDMPVKRYSSGMYTRLAFSVAAHLESEILIVDEVLAVGDLAFQRKCMGKMSAVARQDRTILFVSHNMSAVRALCTRGIILEHGRVTMEGTAAAAAAAYVNSNNNRANIADAGLDNRMGRTSGAVRFTGFRMEDEGGRERSTFQEGADVRMVLSYKAFQAVPGLSFQAQLRSVATKECVTTVQTVVSEKELSPGYEATVCLTLPSVPLRPGDYSLYLVLSNKEGERHYDVIDENLSLPHLSITSEEDDTHEVLGCFSIPWRLTAGPAEVRQ
jgi:lipopolysaccharide transport system ATP-binding protein